MIRKQSGFGRGYAHEGMQRLVLGGICLLALLITGTAWLLLAPQERSVVAQEPVQALSSPLQARLQEVLVPIRDIEANSLLTSDLFRQELRSQEAIPAGSLQSIIEVEGRYAKAFLPQSYPVFRGSLSTIRPAAGIRWNIPAGYRAVSIRVDQLTSVSGFARPKARVDVVWLSTFSGKRKLVPLVQNVEILAVEQVTEVDERAGTPIPQTVTLLLSSRDANKVQYAAASGSLSLNLRGESNETSPGDQEPVGEGDIIPPNGEPAREAQCEGKVIIDHQAFCMMKNGQLRVAQD